MDDEKKKQTVQIQKHAEKETIRRFYKAERLKLMWKILSTIDAIYDWCEIIKELLEESIGYQKENKRGK